MFLQVSVHMGKGLFLGGWVPGPRGAWWVCSGGAWSGGVPGLGGSAPGEGGAWFGGGACSGGFCSGGVPGGDPPGRLLLRAVRILLKCILVSHLITTCLQVPKTANIREWRDWPLGV